MRCLWLLSAGVSDVQLPLWLADADGAFHSTRFEPKSGARALHAQLLQLLGMDLLDFSLRDLPPRDESRQHAVEFELLLEHGELIGAHYKPVGGAVIARLHPEAEFPSPDLPRLPLLFPKVQPLLPVVRERAGRGPLTVVVLNTCRNEAAHPAEPVAAGPLLARFLAEHLQLPLLTPDAQAGAITDASVDTGAALWLNLLQGHETAEDPAAQQAVAGRLAAVFGAWAAGGADGHVIVTTTGGIPQLKDPVERMAAAWFGDAKVQLLRDVGHAGRGIEWLAYRDKWSEREGLRFHCAEALRAGDLPAAYGLARRYPQAPWARPVLDFLGPALDMPCDAPWQLGRLALPWWAVLAVRVEAAAAMGDARGALLRLHAFLEAVAWELLARDKRMADAGLTVNAWEHRIQGTMPDPNLGMPPLGQNDDGGLQPLQLMWRWPEWMAEGGAPGGEAFQWLANRYARSGYRCQALRRLRNDVAHGGVLAADTAALQQELIRSELFRALGQSLGWNFLQAPRVAALLQALEPGERPLGQRMVDESAALLTEVLNA